MLARRGPRWPAEAPAGPSPEPSRLPPILASSQADTLAWAPFPDPLTLHVSRPHPEALCRLHRRRVASQRCSLEFLEGAVGCASGQR